MTCLPQAGFVPKCGQKLECLGGILDCRQHREEIYAELGFLVPSFVQRYSERVLFEERQEWGFVDQVGVSWRFQPNRLI